MNGTKWSKTEKQIARQAYEAAYTRECAEIGKTVRKMAATASDPSGLWELHDYLTKRRREIDEKYDYRYSQLTLVFARLIYEGWLKPEDLAGISKDKLQEICRIAEFASSSQCGQ
ncbi:MAG: hypothetical protein QUS07_08430 [Methanothrix sp.]|nr:hypothetical protein [Methanothrix sp.]